MTSPELAVLDVGHGNCTVIIDPGVGVTVVDCPRLPTPLEFLEHHGIDTIDVAVLSHADEDHAGGLAALLLSRHVRVRTLLVNADRRNTLAWRELRTALGMAMRERGTRWYPLTTDSSEYLPRGAFRVEVLAPSAAQALGAGGGHDLDGRVQDANTMSGVLRVFQGSRPAALLCADIDHVALARILEEQPRPTAEVLVFPHHGGRPGRGDPAAFAEQLTRAVEPTLVVFSIGRGVHDNPRPEVVAAVQASAPGSRLACTQLSRLCAPDVPGVPRTLIHPSAGSRAGSCCAGTVRISLREESLLYDLDAHAEFVDSLGPTALCRR